MWVESANGWSVGRLCNILNFMPGWGRIGAGRFKRIEMC